MPLTMQPLLVLYVLWHPNFTEGEQIAERLFEHYRRNSHENVTGGIGVSVIFRNAIAPGETAPIEIDFNEAKTTAVVTLIDESFVNDAAWVTHIKTLTEQASTNGLSAHIFPVGIDPSWLKIGLKEQAIRWDKWTGDLETRQKKLISSLAYELCRLMRHFLEHLKRPMEEEDALIAYLQRVNIFLSHSKHDQDGERIAIAIRDWMHQNNSLNSFFDVLDIPSSLQFDKVIPVQVKQSAVIAVHTDSYSSREWCRREIIEAKRWNVPLVVANCISDREERGFPYMGNVPVVRMNPGELDRIEIIVARLLDEVLKDFIWRCHVELARPIAEANVFFSPRPPELISLAGLPSREDQPNPVLVYPDPPLSTEEDRLFESVAPHVQLRSWNEWYAGATR